MRIFAWGSRKRLFSGCQTLRLRHLTKWGEHYYIVLFSLLSSFHWPWLLECSFCVHFHYYEQRFSDLSYGAICRISLLYDVTIRDVGSGRWKTWSAEYCGSAKGLRIFRRRKVAGATSSEL